MNREQAKIWAKIPRKELKIIAPNIDKHFDVLRAYANGKEIEVKDLENWYDIEDPSFERNEEYRVKPSNDQSSESYMPRYGDMYFIIDDDGYTFTRKWLDDPVDIRRFDFGNCFLTEVACKAASERVRAVLKDPLYLSDGEKNLIKALRAVRIDGIYRENKSWGLISHEEHHIDPHQWVAFSIEDLFKPEIKINAIIDAIAKIEKEQYENRHNKKHSTQ